MVEMTVEFDKSVESLLYRHARLGGVGPVDILRRAIGTYSYLDEQYAQGRWVDIFNKETGEVKRLEWFEGDTLPDVVGVPVAQLEFPKYGQR